MGQAWRFRGLQVTKGEHPWARGKWSAQLRAFLRLLPLGVGRRPGLVLTGWLPGSLCSHALPLARRNGEKEEEEEGRERKEKEREGKIFKCDILSFVI